MILLERDIGPALLGVTFTRHHTSTPKPKNLAKHLQNQPARPERKDRAQPN